MINFINKSPLSKLWAAYTKGSLSFPCLNTAQFLGALNDNIYKPLTIFFLLSVLGQEKSSIILSTVGALYVVPFLLFSSMGGVLADRFSKQKLIQILKGAEIFFMLLALWAFHTQSQTGCYLLLFLVATHSALFGPSKYGILPELVDKSQLPKANGAITGCTYLAIIIGTFLASFFTDISDGNFLIGVSFCLLFSLIGFFSAFGIKKTPSQKSIKKISPLFLKEIMGTIKECKRYPLLIPCLIGSAYFLFIGAFTQLNIIPLAMESLHLSAYAGGYLFLFTAIGIAVGSFMSGKMLKKRPSLGLSCLSGLAIGLLFILISLFGSSIFMVALLLAIVGVFGGMFILSFDTFIQINSPEGKRGQTIAAGNFLSFVGVLIAAAFLYLSGDVFHFSARISFLVIGIITLCISFLLVILLFEVALPFFARHFNFFKKISIFDPLEALKNGSVFIMEKKHLSLLWAVLRQTDRCDLLFIQEKTSIFDQTLAFSPSIHFLSYEGSFEDIIKKAKLYKKEDSALCILCNFPIEDGIYKTPFSFFPFREETIYTLLLEKNPEGNLMIAVKSL
jgi:acyl-[acyl-carrier-protein]-phospholipid O-acyltransferase/long-chain-fatty-acid--[acyl-carrier-protein] ligase